MPRCRVDQSIKRVVMAGVSFPLGAYPVEPLAAREGYTVWFEPADGDDEGEWEEWPDRYAFEIMISATRLEALVRSLLTLLPGRIYPIVDFLGHDAFREVDPYVSYDLVGQERLVDAMRRYRGFFFEDGLVGLGAMSEEPFVYIFVDEHKLVTVRVEAPLRDRVEAVLAAFDVQEVEELATTDSVTHEHRTVLEAPEDRSDLLNADEIIEELRDEWGLVLNIDSEQNVDDEEHPLGITGWRCLVRWEPLAEPESEAKGGPPPAARYAEVLLTAGSLGAAETLATEATAELVPAAERDEGEAVPVFLDRVTGEEFAQMARDAGAGPVDAGSEQAWACRWL
ncbi:MAG TPA: hypothetical protein VD963_03070 [Phycisphaerales bacterium]|nr:hypothetical protein [Phycisphaerales bacterium]